MTPWWVLVLAGIVGLTAGSYAGWQFGIAYGHGKEARRKARQARDDARYLAQFDRPCRILEDFASSMGSQEYCGTHGRLLSTCNPKTKSHLEWPYNGLERQT